RELECLTWMRPATAIAIGAPVIIFALQCLGVTWPVIGSGWARLSPADWPVAAETALRDAVRRSASHGRVFNELAFGGYLIYRVPEAKVYIDDRCELYGESGLRRYVELLCDPKQFVAQARYYDVRV